MFRHHAYPHEKIHHDLKLLIDFLGDDETCKSDTRLYLYIIKEENICATNEQINSSNLHGIVNVKISVHGIFANTRH